MLPYFLLFVGADNIVVIWKHTGQGVLKYSHSSPLQFVRFNPAKVVLVSCSDADYGFWSPEQKQVVKEKMPSRILSAAWSSDGETLAIGMQSGIVSVRNTKSEVLEYLTIPAMIDSTALGTQSHRPQSSDLVPYLSAI